MCTVKPADGHRLEDGEKQQAGSAAREMVVDLEHVEATLQKGPDEGANMSTKQTKKTLLP